MCCLIGILSLEWFRWIFEWPVAMRCIGCRPLSKYQRLKLSHAVIVAYTDFIIAYTHLKLHAHGWKPACGFFANRGHINCRKFSLSQRFWHFLMEGYFFGVAVFVSKTFSGHHLTPKGGGAWGTAMEDRSRIKLKLNFLIKLILFYIIISYYET